jgi:hypothetical protein
MAMLVISGHPGLVMESVAKAGASLRNHGVSRLLRDASTVGRNRSGFHAELNSPFGWHGAGRQRQPIANAVKVRPEQTGPASAKRQ